jgi:uncharacterized membrane protein
MLDERWKLTSMLAPRPTKLRSQRDVSLGRIPLYLSLAAVALFGITLIPDILDKFGFIHILSWLTMGSIDDARAILSAMMGAVATVLALIFSVALLVLSMVSTLFGPRLLYRFLQDWVTQVTIGLFMGTFVCICLVFLVTHQDPTSSRRRGIGHAPPSTRYPGPPAASRNRPHSTPRTAISVTIVKHVLQ